VGSRRSPGVGVNEQTIPMLTEIVVSGMLDKLYETSGYDRRLNTTVKDNCHFFYRGERQLSDRSVVTSVDNYGTLLVGEPLDLEVQARRGGTFTLRLLSMVTVVPDVEWVLRYAPHCAEVQRSDWGWSHSGQKPYCTMELTLDGVQFMKSSPRKQYFEFDELKQLFADDPQGYRQACAEIADSVKSNPPNDLPSEIAAMIPARRPEPARVVLVAPRFNAPEQFGTSLAGLLNR